MRVYIVHSCKHSFDALELLSSAQEDIFETILRANRQYRLNRDEVTKALKYVLEDTLISVGVIPACVLLVCARITLKSYNLDQSLKLYADLLTKKLWARKDFRRQSPQQPKTQTRDTVLSKLEAELQRVIHSRISSHLQEILSAFDLSDTIGMVAFHGSPISYPALTISISPDGVDLCSMKLCLTDYFMSEDFIIAFKGLEFDLLGATRPHSQVLQLTIYTREALMFSINVDWDSYMDQRYREYDHLRTAITNAERPFDLQAAYATLREENRI